MASQPLLECSFLIPVRRDRFLSDGKRHKQDAWTWLEHSLLVFNGATCALELYEGWYLDPDSGEPVRDQSRKYIVALHRTRLGELRDLLVEACRKFKQKCIYLSVAGRVEFVEGQRDAQA